MQHKPHYSLLHATKRLQTQNNCFSLWSQQMCNNYQLSIDYQKMSLTNRDECNYERVGFSVWSVCLADKAWHRQRRAAETNKPYHRGDQVNCVVSGEHWIVCVDSQKAQQKVCIAVNPLQWCNDDWWSPGILINDSSVFPGQLKTSVSGSMANCQPFYIFTLVFTAVLATCHLYSVVHK